MDRRQRLPPELRKRIQDYRKHQRWEPPIGAVPAYSGTYLESLEGMHPLRETIQRHVTSCRPYLKVTGIATEFSGMAMIYGKARTQFGDYQTFHLYLNARDAFRVSQEIEELEAGLRNHVLIDPDIPPEQQTYIARLMEPIGMISNKDLIRGISYEESVVLRYCHELLDAIAQVHRGFEGLADYEDRH